MQRRAVSSEPDRPVPQPSRRFDALESEQLVEISARERVSARDREADMFDQVRGAYRLCSISAFPSGSSKIAMWQTPVSNVSPRNSTPFGLELGPSRRYVFDVKCRMASLCGRELHPLLGRFPNPETSLVDPEFILRLVVLAETERVYVESAGAVGIG